MKVKELMRMLHGLEDFDLKDCGITTEILDALEAKPVVHGHWISLPPRNYVQKECGYFKCSNCGVHIINKWNYCPNCGARMVEDDD